MGGVNVFDFAISLFDNVIQFSKSLFNLLNGEIEIFGANVKVLYIVGGGLAIASIGASIVKAVIR